MDGAGHLQSIRELTHIERSPDGIQYRDANGNWQSLAPDSIVSLNFWGFTPAFFDDLARLFPAFLRSHAGDPNKAEFYLPEAVGTVVREGTAQVRVLPTDARLVRRDLPGGPACRAGGCSRVDRRRAVSRAAVG